MSTYQAKVILVMQLINLKYINYVKEIKPVKNQLIFFFIIKQSNVNI